jgi:shikimate kinase
MNIVLIGYRGTGKTHVTRILSQVLSCPAVSLDQEIVRSAGLSIPDIVEKFGWDHFRDLESQAVRETSVRDNLIIDCGGGVILREENTHTLRENGFIVLLLANKNTIIKRISGGSDRPSLTGGKSFIAEVEEVLNQRMPLYLAAADLQIDTTEIPPDAVAQRIITELKSRSLIEK